MRIGRLVDENLLPCLRLLYDGTDLDIVLLKLKTAPWALWHLGLGLSYWEHRGHWLRHSLVPAMLWHIHFALFAELICDLRQRWPCCTCHARLAFIVSYDVSRCWPRNLLAKFREYSVFGGRSSCLVIKRTHEPWMLILNDDLWLNVLQIVFKPLQAVFIIHHQLLELEWDIGLRKLAFLKNFRLIAGHSTLHNGCARLLFGHQQVWLIV